MSLTSELYGVRRCGSSHGDVFTSPRIVSFMLDLMGYTSDKDLSTVKILEPSFGAGDFLVEIQDRLLQSARKYHFDACEVMSDNVYGCEIDTAKYAECVDRLKRVMPGFTPNKFKNQDFLQSEWDVEFDYIIGNPPYVRYENIPCDAREVYKKKFKTFHYRCDLYVLFYEHCLKNLSENGRHCFICSNRWIKNEYGRKLRQLISTSYNLQYLIDVEKLDAFGESVLAYPEITLISNNEGEGKVKMATANQLNELSLDMPLKERPLPNTSNWDSLFLENGSPEFPTVEEQGFVVGIGVATGADNLFISSDLKSQVERELLIPVVRAKDLTGNQFNWHGLYLLNPYGSDGNLIDLIKYPKARKYLERYRERLENRHIVKNGRVWYSLIDKVKPNLMSQPKILLPDISGNRRIFVDDGSFYPAHNIYYITGKNNESLIVLASVLMSDFVKNQVKSISNKMNGGIPRWQSQSIKKIRLPRLSDIEIEITNALVDAYHHCDYGKINSLVDEIVYAQTYNNSLEPLRSVPETLFDFDFHGE